ncbi:TIM-barrel domain-containing protein [Thermosipho sp. 1244]|uniref:TIM-barrel domain-containing protein n=1 Tax=Thermosipho sp. 1244 TaxID=1755816 RepID=UPI001BDDDACB|nr:TIM-barrel domain-containing protein [Thermosipho sp. 1244]MBT1247837.1 alpha-glucosidase [Thermosipho sp. 1244]
MIYKVIYGNPDVSSEAVVNEKKLKLIDQEYLRNVIFDDCLLKKEKEYLILRIKLKDKRGFYFGFGDKVGPLNRKGRRYIFWNTDDFIHHPGAEPLYKSFPFFIYISKNMKFGIFTDYPGYMEIDLDSEGKGEIEFKVRGEGFNQYIILEEKVKKILKQYLYLTGKNVAFPFWSLGYQQSRWSYSSQSEVLQIAKKFRDKNIPCDVIWFDIDYMEGYKIFTWNKENFSNYKLMLEKLHNMGFKVSAILDPGVKVEKNYEVFEEAKDRYFLKDTSGKDFEGAVWPGRVRFPDFCENKVRKWWARKVNKLLEDGIDGFWNDMNEIAIFASEKDIENAKEKLKNIKLEDGIKVANVIGEIGEIKKRGRGDEIVHLSGKKHYKLKNVYGFNMIRATFGGFPKNKRKLIITRSAYSGVQRYGGVWTGDNHSWWEHILLEIQRINSLSMVGVFNSGFDVGGFGGNVEPELMVRFMQLGVFMPLFRNHSAIGTRRQEPWSFDTEYEELLKDVIVYRYKLIPYLYTSYMLGILEDIPLIAPIFYHFENDEESYQVFDQFMVGKSLLVAPVYNPGVTKRMVYLPKRALNFNNKIFVRKGWNLVDAPLSKIPHFILDGSIVFMQDEVQYLKNSYNDVLTAHVVAYNDKAVGYLYEDDGESYNYKKGLYNLYKVVYDKGNVQFLTKRNGFLHRKRKIKFKIYRKSGLDEFELEF